MSSTFSLPRLLVCVALLAACGDDSTGPTGGSGGEAQGGQGGTSTGGGGEGPMGGGGNGDGGGGQAAGGAGGGAGTICGGKAGARCEDNEFCDFDNDFCGGDDSTGICQPRPTDCPAVDEPTCGCDGTVHSNSCDANAAGYDVSIRGCEAPEGTFACGAGFCDLASEYCLEVPNDTATPPPVYYSCEQLPAPCVGGGLVSCDCAGEVAEQCGGECDDTSTDGIIIRCPGG